MRRPLIPSALALLLFPACPAAESFSADLENDEDEVAWLLGSDSGLSISVQAEVDGTLQSLYPSAAWLCMPECGAPAGMVACAASLYNQPRFVSDNEVVPGFVSSAYSLANFINTVGGTISLRAAASLITRPIF